MSEADSKVWLVKLPGFLSDVWCSKESEDKELATIRVTYDPTTDVVPPQCTVELLGEAAEELPKTYSMQLQSDTLPAHVFSQSEGHLAFEGKVSERGDMKVTLRVYITRTTFTSWS